MKRFLIKLVYFLLPLLILAYPLDYLVSYWLKQTHEDADEYQVWNDIYDSNAKCDIAIYGSSRACVNINPQILINSLKMDVYNFGMNASNFDLQYLRHIELIKYNPSPKIIILSLDIFSLCERKASPFGQFLPYMLWNSDIWKYISHYDESSLDYYIPLFRYACKNAATISIIKSIVRSVFGNEYKRKKGFFSFDKQWNNNLKQQLKEYFDMGVRHYGNLGIIEISPHYKSLFEKFINECKNNNIKLIFVYPPEHIEGQKFILNREEIITVYRDFAKKYSIKFYDYSNDSICLNKKYFFNSLHLNKLGADVFTKKLAKDIISTQ